MDQVKQFDTSKAPYCTHVTPSEPFIAKAWFDWSKVVVMVQRWATAVNLGNHKEPYDNHSRSGRVLGREVSCMESRCALHGKVAARYAAQFDGVFHEAKVTN